jgi:hypothetical protein
MKTEEVCDEGANLLKDMIGVGDWVNAHLIR